MERIGIFGGTFSPPHIGHTRSAQVFQTELMLDKVIVMPACIPPHKKINDPGVELRLEMTRASFSNMENVTVSDYEIEKKGVSYTVDTLTHFSKATRELWLLCGGDMFMSLPEWRCPEKIFSLARIACLSREKDSLPTLSERAKAYEVRYGAKCRILYDEPVVISSTELRNMIKRGENTSEYLCPQVQRIIEREGLYK